MHFLIMNKSVNIIGISFLLLLLVTCSKLPNRYDQIDAFLKKELNFQDLDKYQKIVVVNELGDCMNCNNSFVEKVALLKSDTTLLFLISTPGSRVDITPFIEKQDNILHDPYGNFEQVDLVRSCAIIELNEQHVDTIIAVNSGNLNGLELLADFYKQE